MLLRRRGRLCNDPVERGKITIIKAAVPGSLSIYNSIKIS